MWTWVAIFLINLIPSYYFEKKFVSEKEPGNFPFFNNGDNMGCNLTSHVNEAVLQGSNGIEVLVQGGIK